MTGEHAAAPDEPRIDSASLLHSIEAVVWSAAPDPFRLTFVSDHAARLLGHPIADWLRDPTFWHDHLHPEDRPWVTSFYRNAPAGRRSFDCEHRLMAADGRIVWVRAIARLVLDGPAPALHGVWVDTTPTHEAREAVDRHFFYRHDRLGRFTYLSPSVSRILGYGPEDYGAHYAEMFTADPVNQEAVRCTERTLRGERLPPYEIEVRAKDGSIHRLEVMEYPVRDAQGTIELVEGTARDVTERWRAEQELRERAERYRRLGAHAPEALLVFDADEQRFLDVNDTAERLLGHSREALLAMRPDDVTLAVPTQPDGRDSREAAREILREAMAEGRPVFEWTFRAADGRDVPCEVRLVRVPGAQRAVLRASLTDISARKKAEAWREGQTYLLATVATHADLDDTLRRLTRLLETQLQGAQCAVVIADDSGGRRAIGASLDAEALGRMCRRDAAAPASWDVCLESRAPVVATDRPAPHRSCWCLPILNDHDGVLGAFVVHAEEPRGPRLAELRFIDSAVQIARIAIEHRRSIDGMRASVLRYRSLFEESLAGHYVAHPDGTLRACNPAFARILGLEAADGAAVPSLWTHYPSREARDVFLDRLQRERRLENHEHELRRRDGTRRRVVENVIGHFDDRGALLEIHGYVIDESDRRRAEEQLRQVQKMDAIGQLASGVAHDFNNVLCVIRGCAELLRHSVDGAHPGRARLDDIHMATERGADLTRQLLAFSRKQVLEPRVLSLNAVVGDVEKMLRRLIGDQVHLATTLAPDLGRVKADRGQIEQVLVNLALNARDAMPRGGRLTIETADASIEADDAERPPDLAPGRYVTFAVGDTGHGIDAETLPHIFEPFFTTKPKERGTGLGLATVYGIVKQSAGAIAVSSAVDRGTVFRVYLPRVEEALSPIAEARLPQAPTARGGEAILLLEDDRALGGVVREFLEMAGYAVLQCGTSDEALSLGLSDERAIDLILADVVVPGIRGHDVVSRIRSRRPGVKVLYMSGHSDEILDPDGVLQGGVDFIAKPFTSDLLLHRIRQVLDGAAPDCGVRDFA